MTRTRQTEGGDDPRYGWAIVAALSVTETISWGIVYYAFAVFLEPMQRTLGFSAVELTGAFSLALLVSAGAGLVVGRWLDHGSPRLVMTAGSVLAALMVAAWSQVDSLAAFYVVWVGLGVAMAAILYEPAFVVLTKWFTVSRHRALTVLTLAGALASPIFSPLAQHLNDELGWRDALLVLATLLAAVTIPLHAAVLRPAPFQAGRRRSAPSRTDLPAPRPRLDPRFWLLCAGFALSAFATSAMAVHLIPVLTESGYSAGFAAAAAGAVGLAQLPGRLLFAGFGQRLPGTTAATAIFTAGALALAVLLVDRSAVAIGLFVVLMGVSNGMATLVRATALGDLYGTHHYGAIASTMAAFTTTARAIAPFGAAALALLPGGYDTALATLVMLTGAAAAAAWQAHRTGSQPLPLRAPAVEGATS